MYKVISIANMKGGVGKSTITMMLASWLHYTQGVKCMVVDADWPQHTIMGLRKSEHRFLEVNEKLKNRVENFYAKRGVKEYPVYGCGPEQFDSNPSLCIREKVEEDTQLVFIDLPGNAESPAVENAFQNAVEFAFVPVEPDNVVINSTIFFIDAIQKVYGNDPESAFRASYMFLNKADDRSSTFNLMASRMPEFSANHCVFLSDKFAIPRRVDFCKDPTIYDRNIFRSTILPMSSSNALKLSIAPFADEIMKLCQIQPNKKPNPTHNERDE